MKKFLPIIALLFVFPTFALAIETPETVADLIAIFTDLVLMAIPLANGVALIVFFWGLAKFILKAGEERARDEGKQLMLWGIIALFILTSLWGILAFFYNDFDFDQGRPFGPPDLPTGSASWHNVG